MATSMILQPGIRYVVAKSGLPSTTLTRNGGVSSVPATGYLRKTGDVVSVADGVLYCDQPIDVSVDLGSVVPSDGSATVLAGASAAARRIINTVGTTAAPTLATDGYLVAGYASVAMVVQTAGNVTFHFWTYDSNSGVWTMSTSADGFGDSAGDLACNNTQIRVTYQLDAKGIDRVYLQVHANGGAAQASAWMKVVPPPTTY